MTLNERVEALEKIVAAMVRDATKKENPIKKIDMSVCIESGIDCEFGDMVEDCQCIGKLADLIDSHFVDTEGDSWYFCRPRMNGHIHASPTGWDKCPLPKGFIIRAWTGTREVEVVFTKVVGYTNVGWKDIRMFQVTGIAEGYEL